MIYYVSSNDVNASIEYFKRADFDSDDMLFLFLLSKHSGITTSYPVTYLTSNLSEQKRKEVLNAIWMLAGLFDSTEDCGKRGVMFPTAFQQLSVYQPGTEFSGVVSRIKDTLQKKNLTAPVYNDNDSMLTLKRNYKELIRENYLKGNKISLSHLSAWVFRYTGFDFEEEPTSKQFTRVIDKAIRKFFRITKNDFLWLFENDLSEKRLTPDSIGITGDAVRSNFDFGDKNPEIRPASPEVLQYSLIEKSVVQKYLAMNGDNPSDQDILDILKDKNHSVPCKLRI